MVGFVAIIMMVKWIGALSDGQMTGSTTLIGDKRMVNFYNLAVVHYCCTGDITANSIRTPSSIGGSPSTISNESSSIDSQGFAGTHLNLSFL